MLYATTDATLEEITGKWNDYISMARISLGLKENQHIESFLRTPFYNHFLRISTRSKLAQMGIDIAKFNARPYFTLKDGKAELEVVITSWGGNKVALKPGDKICRFYFINNVMLDKEKLEELIGRGELDLGPNSRIYNDIGVVEIRPKNIKLKLKKGTKNPLTLEDLSDLDSLLEVEEANELLVNPNEFLLTETHPIKLPHYCFAEIMIASDRGETIHLWSPLIDLGFSKPVRLEFFNYNLKPVKPIAYLYVFANF